MRPGQAGRHGRLPAWGGSGSLGLGACGSDRKFDGECGPFADGALDANSSLVCLDDVATRAQSQSGASFAGFIRSSFCGEVGVKDARQFFLGNATAVIPDEQIDHVVLRVVCQSNPDFSAIGHRLPGVGQQIHQNLLDFISDGQHVGYISRLKVDLDAVFVHFSLQKQERIADQLREIRWFRRTGAVPCHSQDVVGDFGGFFACVEDFGEGLFTRCVIAVPQTHLGVIECCHEEVVEFVRGGSEQFTQSTHFLRLFELLLERGDFGLMAGR